MSPEKLTYMANQIAAFFHSQPGGQGAEGVATHINKFWEARMRRTLFQIAETEGNGLDALVVKAVPLIRRPEEQVKQDG